MLLFNSILLIHFICFAAYLCTLLAQWQDYATRVRGPWGLILGILLLVSGLLLVLLKYPHVNYCGGAGVIKKSPLATPIDSVAAFCSPIYFISIIG